MYFTFMFFHSGVQLDFWLTIMVLMDLAPLAWCLVRALRHITFGNQPPTHSSAELIGPHRSNDPQPNGSSAYLLNQSNHYHAVEDFPSVLTSDAMTEAAEFVSATMKNWSPAYQLNEMIMQKVDGCIFSHASLCKYLK